jgi:hypothetical protein
MLDAAWTRLGPRWTQLDQLRLSWWRDRIELASASAA